MNVRTSGKADSRLAIAVLQKLADTDDQMRKHRQLIVGLDAPHQCGYQEGRPSAGASGRSPKNFMGYSSK